MQTYLRDAVLVMLEDCASSQAERERLLTMLESDRPSFRRHLRREAARLRRKAAPRLDSQELFEDMIVEERRLRSAAWMWTRLSPAQREAILGTAVTSGLIEPDVLRYEIESELPEVERSLGED